MMATSTSRGVVRRNNRLFYSLHSALVLSVLAWGMIRNVGRKYIPVDPGKLLDLARASGRAETTSAGSCRRAYVDVYSSGIEEDLAAVCCPAAGEGGDGGEVGRYRSGLCDPRIAGVSTRRLPFASGLTRLAEAWLLPLLPILIRLAYQLTAFARGRNRNGDGEREVTSSSSLGHSSYSSVSPRKPAETEEQGSDENAADRRPGCGSMRATLRRLLLYFGVLNVRGWVLYIGANALEDRVTLPRLSGNAEDASECWYGDALKSYQTSSAEYDHSGCYGRQFDFSDHVVLFLVNYLAIFAMEMVVCRSCPFWDKGGRSAGFLPPGAIWSAAHVALFLYLHAIVLRALHQTAVYFHTPAEIMAGYGVSLFVQLPLMYLMCI